MALPLSLCSWIAPDHGSFPFGPREPVRLGNVLSASVAEHADAGKFTFIRWIATGTGSARHFEDIEINRILLSTGECRRNASVPTTRPASPLPSSDQLVSEM